MAYPAEPFKQADSLLTGLMESYRGSRDAADMMDIQSLLDTTMRIARDREYNVQQSIKELTQRAAGLEAEAVYSDAKAAHEQRVQDINGVIEELQLDVQRASSDINSTHDQRQQLTASQKQLQADKEQLAQLQLMVEPDKLKRITLYAHISDMAFDYDSLKQPLARATVSDAAAGDIRTISVDLHNSSYAAVNALWDAIAPAQR